MAKSIGTKAPEYQRASQLRLDDRPDEYAFALESQKTKVGTGASVMAHIAVIAVVLLVIRLAPQALPPEITDPLNINMLVFLPVPGPGGGGGGGGEKAPEPPRKAQVEQKKDPISVPAPKAPDPTPEKPQEPPPLEILVPVKPMSSAELTLPGVIQPSTTNTAGSGDKGGAGSGTGGGAGPGQGTGLGPGFGGGFGGGAYRPGSGITLPSVLREVKPAYTADAMRAKVQGSVWLECIVMPDGTVGDVKVTLSLDPIFGLDQEAIKAAKNWRFRPGMRQGEPVPVIITIELTFTLR